MHVAGLVNADLVRFRCIINAALSESDGMVIEAICDVSDDFHFEASSDAPGSSVEGSSDQA